MSTLRLEVLPGVFCESPDRPGGPGVVRVTTEVSGHDLYMACRQVIWHPDWAKKLKRSPFHLLYRDVRDGVSCLRLREWWSLQNQELVSDVIWHDAASGSFVWKTGGVYHRAGGA